MDFLMLTGDLLPFIHKSQARFAQTPRFSLTRQALAREAFRPPLLADAD
ncbi:hypothetical protein ACVBEH_24935 [Roseateles sp. GG27B]